MAGLPWFELDVDMPDDPKCVNLGARLKNPLAFGYVVRLYAYCYRHATDSFSGPGAVCTIETAAGWRGRNGTLHAALVAEGFIDPAGEESFTVHGVGKRLGPHLAKRERDAARARERRADAEAAVAQVSPRRPRDVRGDRDRDRDRSPTEVSLQLSQVSVPTGVVRGET